MSSSIDDLFSSIWLKGFQERDERFQKNRKLDNDKWQLISILLQSLVTLNYISKEGRNNRENSSLLIQNIYYFILTELEW